MNYQKALITGSTSGIGEALVRLLAQKRIKLLLTGRNQKKLEQLRQEIPVEEVWTCDLQNRQDRKGLIEKIQKYLPDLLINNAGFGIYGDVLSISVEEQLSILEVNAMAALELTLETARAWIQAGKKGCIMNISSVAGEYPCPGMSVYGASKAFLTNVSQSLHTELSSHGISILVSCPGMVATDFASRAAKKPISSSSGPVLTPTFAAQEIWKQIEQGKKKHIFDWHYRLASLAAKYFAPTSVTSKIIWNRIKQRI
jgi:short-subunit dehydrogenase